MARWPHVASTCSKGAGETEICGNLYRVGATDGTCKGRLWVGKSLLYTGKEKKMCDINPPSEVCPGGDQISPVFLFFCFLFSAPE